MKKPAFFIQCVVYIVFTQRFLCILYIDKVDLADLLARGSIRPRVHREVLWLHHS